jgi:hypothetical protein
MAYGTQTIGIKLPLIDTENVRKFHLATSMSYPLDALLLLNVILKLSYVKNSDIEIIIIDSISQEWKEKEVV